jgi:GTP-binding protein Era
MGIINDADAQIVFSDTPGVLKPNYKLQESMLAFSESALVDADVLLYVTDPIEKIDKNSDFLQKVSKMEVPIIVLINKIDLTDEKNLVALVEQWHDVLPQAEIVPISALKGKNTDRLIKVVSEYLEEGPQYFPEYMITDQPERVLISELIREKVLHYVHDEIPHGVAVEIERMRKRPDKDIIDVSAVIYCERDSHKGIIIGKNGRKLKGIGKSAREDIELLLGSQINLQVWVKVKENWRNLQSFINNFGYTDK